MRREDAEDAEKIVWLLAVPLLCVLACTVLTARAGAKESISLSADGSEAEVTLEVPQEMVNEGNGWCPCSSVSR